MFILEAVPDMMMMICLQIFFIWVLQKFGESPVTIISFNENRAYLLPILSLAVLPTLQMFRMMVLYIKRRARKTLRRGCIWKRPFIKLYTMHSFIQKYIYPLLPPFKTILFSYFLIYSF